MPKLIANIFIVVALLIFWAARRNACRTTDRMKEHATESQSTGMVTLISGILAAGAIATGIVLWLL